MVVGAYSVLISISFAIVTSLYMTGSGTGCENIEAENAKIVSVTHVSRALVLECSPENQKMRCTEVH